ncbi:MAG: hypothetical protein JKY65_07770 [Planctomycetes bacterium]|nr:hypothetical protein [Planctomycetota bacterium]
MSAEAFGGQNLAYVEELYYQWLDDPASVGSEWVQLFEPMRVEEPAARRPTEPSAPTIFNPGSGSSANGAGASKKASSFRSESTGSRTAFADAATSRRPSIPSAGRARRFRSSSPPITVSPTPTWTAPATRSCSARA